MSVYFKQPESGMKNFEEGFLKITASTRDQQTYLSKSNFESPLSLSRPFKMANGGLKIYTISSSPGLFEKDVNEYTFNVEEQARLVVSTPTYSAMFKMPEYSATQRVEGNIKKEAYLKYIPKPTIPYKNSKVNTEINIHLKDPSSKYSSIDVLSSGRIGLGEVFEFSYYNVLTNVYQAGQLIYKENLRLDTEQFKLDGFGMMESHSHFATVVAVNLQPTPKKMKTIRDYYDDHQIYAGITLHTEEIAVAKIFGNTSDFCMKHAEKTIEMLEDQDLKFE